MLNSPLKVFFGLSELILGVIAAQEVNAVDGVSLHPFLDVLEGLGICVNSSGRGRGRRKRGTTGREGGGGGRGRSYIFRYNAPRPLSPFPLSKLTRFVKVSYRS
jgi:hypothetical protein